MQQAHHEAMINGRRVAAPEDLVQDTPLYNGPPPKNVYAYGNYDPRVRMTPRGYQVTPAPRIPSKAEIQAMPTQEELANRFRQHFNVEHHVDRDKFTPMHGKGVHVFQGASAATDELRLGSMKKKNAPKHEHGDRNESRDGKRPSHEFKKVEDDEDSKKFSEIAKEESKKKVEEEAKKEEQTKKEEKIKNDENEKKEEQAKKDEQEKKEQQLRKEKQD